MKWAAATGKAEWTKRLIPDVARWLGGPPDAVVTYHLAQALTEPGSFRAFLYSRKRTPDPDCPYYPEVWDDVEHTLLVCPHFTAAREDLARCLGSPLVPDDIDGIMCGDHRVALVDNLTLRAYIQTWEAEMRRTLVKMVDGIMATKEAEGTGGGWKKGEAETTTTAATATSSGRRKRTRAARGRRRCSRIEEKNV